MWREGADPYGGIGRNFSPKYWRKKEQRFKKSNTKSDLKIP